MCDDRDITVFCVRKKGEHGKHVTSAIYQPEYTNVRDTKTLNLLLIYLTGV